MIGRLTGQLTEKNPPHIILEVQGVGYEVDVPMSTFYHLPELGETVKLHIHFAVREDGHFLYGFLSEAERVAFRQLLKISGVGARTALALLSGLSVGDLSAAIARQDASLLVKVPGIGNKTAERLLLELKGKFGNALATADTRSAHHDQSDVQNALLALGYNEREAALALKGLPAGLSTSDGIRHALKLLAKN